MSLLATDTGGGDFKKVSQGAHIAVCNQIIDLGEQTSEWEGNVKILPKCYVRFEVPSQRHTWTDKDKIEHEGPMIIGKTYTVGLGEKYTMRMHFEGWRGKAFTEAEKKGFEIRQMLGQACQLSVTHKPKPGGSGTYAKIDAIMALPEGVVAPEPENDLFYYDSESGNYDDLPKWAKEKIHPPFAGSTERTGGMAPVEDAFDDDIPF